MSRSTAVKTVRAFLNGDKLKVNNTQTNGTELYLFGNKIAYKKDNDIIISMCGYNTITTKDRLNCLIDHVRPDFKIFSKDYTPFLVNCRTNESLKLNAQDEYNLNEVLKND